MQNMIAKLAVNPKPPLEGAFLPGQFQIIPKE
jgi:hypothetical protein